jgi:hypothetical protein
MMFNRKTVLGLAVAAALLPSAFGTGIIVDTDATAEQLVALLVGPGVMVKNIKLIGAASQSAIFTDESDDLVFGFTDGIVLSTGTVNNVRGPADDRGNQGTNVFIPGTRTTVPGDADIDREFFGDSPRSVNAAILEFEFMCPPLTTSSGFSFRYVFGSDEYNEYVDSPFNDAFAFFLNGKNIALLPNGDPVSIDNVNCGRINVDGLGDSDGTGDFNTNRTENFCQEIFIDNRAQDNDGNPTGVAKIDTRFDGFTRPIFTDESPPAGFNKLKIVIADASDPFFDSAVLLEGNSLVCAPPPIPPSSGGGSQGDPHFKTWRGQHYDFHGECDLVLLRSKEFESGLGLDVHIRTQMRRDMSYISGAALRIGSDVLEVESQGVYYLNGVAGAELPREFSGFEFLHTQPTANQHVFEVHLGGQESIKVSTYKDFVAVLIEQGQQKHFADSVGLMGDFAYGVQLSRDGKTVMTDVNAFGQEWQVCATDPALFQTARFPQYPQKCTLPSTMATSMLRRRLSESSVDELAAEKACAHWGDGKDDCVFDVLATGDLEMAMVGAY